MARTLFKNIGALLTLQGAAEKEARGVEEKDLSIISRAAILVEKEKILWVGPQKGLPRGLSKGARVVDLRGSTVLPGFIESHTHSLFAGSRAAEFELRQRGVSYQEIAAQGGGILSTVRATRQASSRLLSEATQSRIQNFVGQGVTTLEIKTGYALEIEEEIRCLKLINSLSRKKNSPLIVGTFLGAHSIPPEFSSAKDYLKSLTEALPRIRRLTKRLDIWIEKGFFEVEESRPYLLRARELGFDLAIHADQLTLSGGSDLAVELGALSADHVIRVGELQISQLARSGGTAVLLPTADLYMKCPYPPARRLVEAGARVALATDFNPGTCPSQDISLVGLLARLEMKMTLPEVIVAYTLGAAFALGLQNEKGSLQPGKDADFMSIQNDWTSLFYSPNGVNPESVYSKGRPIHFR